MLLKIKNFLRAKLRKFILEEIWLEDYIQMGMKVGKNCSIQPGVVFDYSHCWLISIGNNVIIAPEAYILAHDASTKRELNYTKIGSVTIEDNVFIGARAIIMPGVTIGENSIIAAGCIVTKDVPKGVIVAGNPSKVICNLEEYMEKQKLMIQKEKNVYDYSYTIKGGIKSKEKEQMYRQLKDSIGFIE